MTSHPTMKAAQFYAAHDLRVTAIPSPTPKPNQLIVDIEWCGICGSDLHEYLVGPRMIPSTTPHVLTGQVLPVTMGHEFCGRVSYVPDSETRLRVGQKVMCDPRMNCRECVRCETKLENMCGKMGFLGLSGGGGGLAEKVAIDANMCYGLPEEVDLNVAALIEPLVVARHALRSSGMAHWKDLNVLILGGGPVGVAVVLDLKCHGAKKIVVSEPSQARRKGLEIHEVRILDPLKENVVARCKELVGQAGVDVVFDCAGIMPALLSGMDALRPQGTYVNVAGWEDPCTVPMASFHFKELIFRASMAYNNDDFADVVKDFVDGKFPLAETMITSRIHLNDVVDKGFEQLIHNKDNHVKIMVTPKVELIS